MPSLYCMFEFVSNNSKLGNLLQLNINMYELSRNDAYDE